MHATKQTVRSQQKAMAQLRCVGYVVAKGMRTDRCRAAAHKKRAGQWGRQSRAHAASQPSAQQADELDRRCGNTHLPPATWLSCFPGALAVAAGPPTASHSRTQAAARRRCLPHRYRRHERPPQCCCCHLAVPWASRRCPWVYQAALHKLMLAHMRHARMVQAAAAGTGEAWGRAWAGSGPCAWQSSGHGWHGFRWPVAWSSPTPRGTPGRCLAGQVCLRLSLLLQDRSECPAAFRSSAVQHQPHLALLPPPRWALLSPCWSAGPCCAAMCVRTERRRAVPRGRRQRRREPGWPALGDAPLPAAHWVALLWLALKRRPWEAAPRAG